MRHDVPTSALCLLALVTVMLAGSACAVGSEHVGNSLLADPATELVTGTTTRADVLRVFGPPDRLIREPGGFAYIYECRLREHRSLTVKEPVILRTDIYSWTEDDERSDRLLVTFDALGRVREWGVRRGTAEPTR